MARLLREKERNDALIREKEYFQADTEATAATLNDMQATANAPSKKPRKKAPKHNNAHVPCKCLFVDYCVCSYKRLNDKGVLLVRHSDGTLLSTS